MKLLKVVYLIALLALLPVAVQAGDVHADELEDQLDDHYTGPAISLDLRDVDIVEVLQLFGELMKKNVVVHSEVVGKVRSLRVYEVAVDNAFEVLLRTKGLLAVTEGNVIMIYPIGRYLEDARQRLQLSKIY